MYVIPFIRSEACESEWFGENRPIKSKLLNVSYWCFPFKYMKDETWMNFIICSMLCRLQVSDATALAQISNKQKSKILANNFASAFNENIFHFMLYKYCFTYPAFPFHFGNFIRFLTLTKISICLTWTDRADHKWIINKRILNLYWHVLNEPPPALPQNNE